MYTQGQGSEGRGGHMFLATLIFQTLRLRWIKLHAWNRLLTIFWWNLRWLICKDLRRRSVGALTSSSSRMGRFWAGVLPECSPTHLARQGVSNCCWCEVVAGIPQSNCLGWSPSLNHPSEVVTNVYNRCHPQNLLPKIISTKKEKVNSNTATPLLKPIQWTLNSAKLWTKGLVDYIEFGRL